MVGRPGKGTFAEVIHKGRDCEVSLSGPVADEWKATGVRLILRYFEGCPNRLVAHARLIAAARETGMPAQVIELERVRTQQEAERLRFVGSPTFVIDGHDLFASAEQPHGLTCRVYETPTGLAGSPTKRQLVAALQQAMNLSLSDESVLPTPGVEQETPPT